jgi:drug/metabolite transporter (DMT)-like permease
VFYTSFIKINLSERKEKMNTTIWLGLVFIFGGVVVLLNQLNILPFELDWWALLILFPAFGTLTSAYNRYRSTNDLFEMGVMIPALVGLFMLLLSVSLLVSDAIDLNLRVYWPIILIVLGLGLIIGRWRRS